MYHLQHRHHYIQAQQRFHINQQRQIKFDRRYCGGIQCHFHTKSVIFKQDILDKTYHQDPSCLNVPHNFVAFNFHDLCQFGKLQRPFRAMTKITIKELQQLFNVKNQRLVSKCLYRKISSMCHTMHINNKWNILPLDLECHS